MKVAIIFLSALALLNLAGNTTAKLVGKKAICNNELVGCPRDFNPVCGTNGITYTNECLLCMENRNRRDPILIKKYGDC